MSTKHRTKWEILEARRDELAEQLAKATIYLEGLNRTPTSGIVCGGCGTPLPTEGDFARHFPIPDERFLNLGYCPKEGPRS